MIYDEPIFRSMGDLAINVEFGDESSIPLNFRILALNFAIAESPLKGIIETNPQVRTLSVVYDQLAVSRAKVEGYLREMIECQGEITTLPSRRLEIPALYDDPWSRECAAQFDVQHNMDYIAAFNNMTIDELVAAHTGTDYWVTGVGFVPGTFVSYAMDPKLRIGAPLYRVPRTQTPARLLNFGGYTSTIYPFENPGGGQLFGRTPIEIFDAEQRNPVFSGGPVLARCGDRHRYRSIDREEYDAIRVEVEAGTYDYQIEEEPFDCAIYLAELESQGVPLEKHDPEATWEVV